MSGSCHYGFVHSGFSCFGVDGDYHAVLSEQLSEDEWKRIGPLIDQMYRPDMKTWDIEGVLSAVTSIRVGVGIIRIDQLR